MKKRSILLLIVFSFIVISVYGCKKDKEQDFASLMPEGYPGYFKDYINIDDFLVRQNKYLKVFMPKKIANPADKEKIINQAALWVEQLTNSKAITSYQHDKCEAVFSQEELQAMDPVLRYINLFNELACFDDKLYIVPNDSTNPSAFENVIHLPSDYYNISVYDSYEFYVLLHELMHVIHNREAKSAGHCRAFIEGYAVWGALRIAQEKDLSDIINLEGATYKVESIPNDFAKAFAEGFWVEEYTDYLYHYGYLFCLYLEEVYGQEIFEKIMVAGEEVYLDENFIVASDNDDWVGKTRAYMERIKHVTSSSVFEDCVIWFNLKKGDVYK